jgi:CHAT domain-containing protein
VVSDPAGNLPAARAEGAAVKRTLDARGGWTVRTLEGERATSQSVIASLSEGPRLFHYAGHGQYAGYEGWESALPLASGSRLALADVLALPRAPAHVVLAGCETARTSDESPVEGLGLAQAFVAAGSEAVVAPLRPVRDDVAARIASALYEGSDRLGASVGVIDVAAALRQALMSARHDDPTSDWAAFRLLTP